MKRQLVFERITVERVTLDVDVPAAMAAADAELLFNHGGFDALLTNVEPRATVRERHDWKLIGSAGSEDQPPAQHPIPPTAPVEVDSRSAKRIARKR